MRRFHFSDENRQAHDDSTEEGESLQVLRENRNPLTDMGLGWFIGFINTEHGSYIFAPMTLIRAQKLKTSQ